MAELPGRPAVRARRRPPLGCSGRLRAPRGMAFMECESLVAGAENSGCCASAFRVSVRPGAAAVRRTGALKLTCLEVRRGVAASGGVARTGCTCRLYPSSALLTSCRANKTAARRPALTAARETRPRRRVSLSVCVCVCVCCARFPPPATARRRCAPEPRHGPARDRRGSGHVVDQGSA